MPQLDYATFPTQIVWLAITFIALYLILSRFALPRISSVLESRQEKIVGDLEKAEGMKTSAEQALAAYEAALAAARGKARELSTATRDRFAREATERQAALKTDLDRRLAEADTRIAQARNAAIANIQGVAADVARSASERLLRIEVEPGRAAAAVADVIKTRG